MDSFKTRFNPLIPLGRILGLLLVIGGIVLVIYDFYIDALESKPSSKAVIVVIGIPIIMGALMYMFGKEFLTKTKNYIICNNSIEETNYLTFSKRIISKEEIKGYSTSFVSYRAGKFKEIVIYLNDGTKISLMQFAYFNFKDIEIALYNKGYNYLGYEPYRWKWFDSRVYHFDE